jgi:predicted negative regulator of RcsB-dependent stress response
VEDYLSEKEQWEWLKGQVRENGPAVVVAIALAVLAVFGWRWWQAHRDAQRLAAGETYMQMVDALDHNDRSKALSLLAQLEREAPASPYADQGKLIAARAYVDQGDLERAANELADVAQHSKDHELALVARLRLARVQIAQGKADGALATLGDPAGTGAFAVSYHEVRGDALYAKGDKSAALNEWRIAKTSGDSEDAPLLDLKIADVSTDVAAPAHQAASPPPVVK